MSNTTYINLYWVNLNENFEEEQKEYVSSYELHTSLDLRKLNDEVKEIVAVSVNDGYRAEISGFGNINYFDIYIIYRTNVKYYINQIGIQLEQRFGAMKIGKDLINFNEEKEKQKTSELVNYYYLEDIDDEEFLELVNRLAQQDIEISYQSIKINYTEKGFSDFGVSILIGLTANLAYDIIKSIIKKESQQIISAKFSRENLIRNVAYNLDLAPATLKILKINSCKNNPFLNIILEDRNNYYEVKCDKYECDLTKSSNCSIKKYSKEDINTPIF